MQLAEHELDDQRATVEAWRLQQLLQAGWAFHRADLIASRPDIDLHDAVWLLDAGCDQKTALRILL